jgi:hypothetical protein
MPARSSTRFRAPQSRSGPTFAQAIERMRSGALLRLEYRQGAPAWTLSGVDITSEVVALILACGEVEPDNDSLLVGTPGQTWRLRP